jgi:transportin-3
VQLSLALSGLALQLPNWDNPVQSMIDLFGRNPATVPILLQFLTVLPEELNGNPRIPVTVSSPLCFTYVTPLIIIQDEEYRERSARILTANSKKILDLLSMYIQASGVCRAGFDVLSIN